MKIVTTITSFLIAITINLSAQSLVIKDFSANCKTTDLINEDFTRNKVTEKKSVALGVVYSLLLPGMGELYANDYSLGKYFTAADILFWGTLFGMNYYGNLKRDDYIAYAQLHASVNPNGKDDVYWGTIGNYDDIYIYNDDMELMREFDKVYNTETHYWKWDEAANRKRYRSMRNSSETAFNNMKFVVSALILNRIASAVNTILLIKKHNNLVGKAELNFGVGINYAQNIPVGLKLNIYGRF